MVNIITLNVKGLNAPNKRGTIWKAIEDLNPDLCCPPVTRFLQRDQLRFRHLTYPNVYHSSASTKQRGVAIYIKKDLPPDSAQS